MCLAKSFKTLALFPKALLREFAKWDAIKAEGDKQMSFGAPFTSFVSESQSCCQEGNKAFK